MILGLAYKARAGKDLAAAYLVKHYGFLRLAFADPLKEAARCIYGFTDEQLYGQLKEVADPFWGETPRVILQKMGTECMRKGHRNDIWIAAAQRKLLGEPDRNWVISDCRFPNEARMIHSLGGKVVRIDATFAGKQIIQAQTHESETAMNTYTDWDHILLNDSTKEAYYKRIDEMLDSTHWIESRGYVGSPETDIFGNPSDKLLKKMSAGYVDGKWKVE